METGIKEHFCTALEDLKDIFEPKEPYSNIVLTGMVALYEILICSAT